MNSKNVAKYANWAKDKGDISPVIEFLCDIDFEHINYNLLDDIELLAPYGNGNIEPKFCTRNVKVVDYKILGATQNTIKFTLEQNGYKLEAICFNDVKDLYFNIGEPTLIDIGYTLSYNVWNGRKSIQLMLVDFNNKD